MQEISINKPVTVYVSFINEFPKLFSIDSDKEKYYYFRYLNTRTPRIKFNITDPGNYYFSTPVKITKIRDIEIPHNLPSLPAPERSRIMPTEFVVNPEYSGLAINYTMIGRIELGKQWMDLPGPMKLYLMLHEKWHAFYLTEKFCDWAAAVDFLRLGYNRSTAYYCLKNLLTKTSENIDRIAELEKFLQSTQKTKL